MHRDQAVVTVFALFLSIAMEAQSAPQFGAIAEPQEKMRYLSDRFEEPTSQFKLRFQEIARIANLDLIFEPRSVGYDVAFHLVATQNGLEKVLLVAVGRRLSDQFSKAISRHEAGFFSQLQAGPQFASIFFLGFNEAEVQSVLKEFNAVYSAEGSKQSSGRTPASETVRSAPNVAHNGQTVPNSETYDFALGEQFAKCGAGVVQGANETAKAILVDPLRILINSALDPKQVWANTVKQWNTLRTSILAFDQVLDISVESFKSLTPAEKSRLYCSFVGAGGAGGTMMKAVRPLFPGSRLPVALPLEKGPFASELTKISQLRVRGTASADPRLSALRDKIKSRLPEGSAGRDLWNYIYTFYPDLPENIALHLARNAKRHTYSGNELIVRNPAPGIESLTFYLGKNGKPTHMSAFLGWGPTTPTRNAVIKSGREIGLKEHPDPYFNDGFLGTSDPAMIAQFVKAYVKPN